MLRALDDGFEPRAAETIHGHRRRLDRQPGLQTDVARELGLPVDAIQQSIDSGAAHAALCGDGALERTLSIEGSPTFLLNEGRQKLYGNVGYRVIEANLQELLRAPDLSEASWC